MKKLVIHIARQGQSLGSFSEEEVSEGKGREKRGGTDKKGKGAGWDLSSTHVQPGSA